MTWPFDDLGGMKTLLRIEVGRRLIDQVDVGGLAQAERQSHTLQLTSGQVLHLLSNHSGVIAIYRKLNICLSHMNKIIR